MIKTLVCLANSRKKSGRCVAGKEVSEGHGWVRPISQLAGGELHGPACTYDGQTYLKPGEIASIDLEKYAGEAPQSENWLVAPGACWVGRGLMEYRRLLNLTDSPGTLWENGSSSTRGTNDRVPALEASKFNFSLALIAPPLVALRFGPLGYEGKWAVYADFAWKDVKYSLRVTDPLVEREYQQQAGNVTLQEALVTVSLGEVYRGFRYKLVAAIITPGSL